MYKILLNITNVHANFLFLKDSGITLSRNNPIATVSTITAEIERNLKTGLLIDVLGNIPVELSEELQKTNEKILYGLNIIKKKAKTNIASTKSKEVKSNGVQTKEDKKEKEEVIAKSEDNDLTSILETSNIEETLVTEESVQEEPKKKTKKKK